jgi:ATP-binding cassette subfamily B protein
VLNLVFFGIYFVIIYQAFKFNFSLGTVVLLITLANQAQFPLFGSSFIIDALQRATADSQDYFEIMSKKPDIIDVDNAKNLNITKGEVSYSNVSFSYQKGQKVLRDISFTIAPGKKLALVGESGEGKSTLANLMLHFYELSSGDITIDGQNISNTSQASLRRMIGVVFQEPQLFSGTLAENIKYSNPKASEKNMIAAAKAANAYDFIKKLPNGFESQIGERGVKLSGGQKQRIAIARAILKNPPILILDEATSSLDSKAENEVQQALEHLMRNRTTMIIAHRLSTIAGVDTVVGLRGGKVIEAGTPAELARKRGGLYAELLSLQSMKPTKAKVMLKKYDMSG